MKWWRKGYRLWPKGSWVVAKQTKVPSRVPEASPLSNSI